MGDHQDHASTAGVVEAFDAATRAIAGLQSVDDVLQVIVDEVRPLVGARYAALGIVDPDGNIERFITSGIDAETRARIGALPRGRGFLGLIIRENRSFRIRDIARDPRRYGFPPNHPPMHSFLGVPVTVQGRSVGNLYLTDKAGAGEFSEDDQRLVETFALHAGIAIENARLHEQVQRLAIVDERERIGKDLHDGIIQSLYAVGLVARGRARSWSARSRRGRAARRAGDRQPPPDDPRHPQLHLRAAARAAERDDARCTASHAIVEEFRHNSMIDVELARRRRSSREPEPGRHGAPAGRRQRGAEQHRPPFRCHARRSSAVETSADGGAAPARRRQRARIRSVRTTGLGHHGLANMRSRIATIGATMEHRQRRDRDQIEIRRAGLHGRHPRGDDTAT